MVSGAGSVGESVSIGGRGDPEPEKKKVMLQ